MRSDRVFSDKYYAAIERRAHTDPHQPPADFDPLSASAKQLAEYGMPARPSPSADPQLFLFWAKMLSPPFRYLTPQFPKRPTQDATVLMDVWVGPGQRVARPSSQFSGYGHRESSHNWSGAYITPQRPKRFVSMVGSWVVPSPAIPNVIPENATRQSVFRSSAWIGFDGHRRLPQASLPQIGTNHEVSVANGVTKIETGAWWQWWKRNPDPVSDPENAPVPITNLAVSAGDEMMAWMSVIVPNDVRFHIKNQTTGDFCTFIVIAPGAIDPIGSTAEWILERPTDIGALHPDPMPHCDDVEFQYCLAQSAQSPTAPTTTQSLRANARLINMYERFTNPRRVAFVLKTTKTGSTTTLVEYQEPRP